MNSDNQSEVWTPHNLPSLGEEERSACARVLSSGWLAPGPEVKAFENEFSNLLGLEEGCSVAVSSGSAALFLALWAAKAEGKNVASPVYACAALRNAVALNRAQISYIDCAEGSPQLDLLDQNFIKAEISIAAHLFGFPAEIEKARCNYLIEDVAQSLGAKRKGKALGTFGESAIFSFYASKLMTSGGHGGMFVSKDRALAGLVKDYIQFDGRKDEALRFNFQMTDLQAAVGREQLKKLGSFISRRKEIYQLYQSAGLPLLMPAGSEDEPVYYRAVVKTQNAAAIKQELMKYKVKSIIPIEDWEVQSQQEASYPNAFELSRSTLSLPIFPKLSDEKAKEIAEIIINSGCL